MKLEKSAGFIIYKNQGEARKYLILFHPSLDKNNPHDVWDFPKGLIEKDETETEAAIRESAEETGLHDLSLKEGFKESFEIFFKFKGELIKKQLTFFLAEADPEEEVTLSYEHTGSAWLSFEQSQAVLLKGSREVLQKAEIFLRRHEQTRASSVNE